MPTDASIAVLPFVSMSADKEQEYFADGISEELLNLLAQVPELRVIARTSSFSFKGKDVEIAEIARRLNVANVLEGSVCKSGDKLRITAQLVRASDSSHLWSERYDRPLDDIFKVQDEIAAAVVEQLKIKLLGGAAPKRPMTDPEAYALFLQAREIDRQYTAAVLEHSDALYEQALALDSQFAAAWVGLAGNYIDEVGAGLRVADAGVERAREALAKALILDSQYAEAHTLLADLAVKFDRNLAAAARHLERALTLEPTSLDVIGFASFLARRLGRLEQAIALGEYWVSRDPVNADGHDNLAYSYAYAGRLDDAIAEHRAVLRLAPGAIAQHEVIGDALLQKGDPKAALAEIQLEAEESTRLVGLSLAYHALGRHSESDAALAKSVMKYQKTNAASIAYVHAFRGEADSAFEWLDKAVELDDPLVGAIPLYPMFANIHEDPRWLPFLRKHGMAPEQLAAIKFDVKVPK